MEIPDLTRDIQNMECEILSEFQRVCKLYNLKYFAIGGTCLGAVRHHGFIPWDDDIDIAMPAEDFFEFKKIAIKELRKPYTIFESSNHKHANLLHVKIHNEDTTFIEEEIAEYKDRFAGVFIDIMPIYGAPNSEKEQRKLFKKYNRYRCFNRVMRSDFSKERNLRGKLLWILFALPRLILPYNYFSERIPALFRKYPYGKMDFVFFGWRVRENRVIFPYKWFENYTELPFEKTTVCVPINYDAYLTKDYGDYMKLPNVEERVSLHPTAVIDLNQSYKNYL